GQYAREAFINLGNWDAVSAKLSLGNNVTEVLNWVAGAGAEVGIVYATDAATTNQVEVIAELPEGLLANPVVYPVGRLAAAGSPGEAAAFLEFLKSPEALAIFGAYGFSPYPGP
ncbi:MAG: molybdate ABC transporter substrate-binding protein, partial [Spirochaetaceae bacterium]|nr:molybdate ABC transporter substrate-binding protein [Spirochaetaceae bacterium]